MAAYDSVVFCLISSLSVEGAISSSVCQSLSLCLFCVVDGCMSILSGNNRVLPMLLSLYAFQTQTFLGNHATKVVVAVTVT